MHTNSSQSITPSIFVVFGATGDLAVKKILPSLWHLFRHKRLPEKLRIIGFSRDAFFDADFQKFVRESVRRRGAKPETPQELAKFLSLFSYERGAFEDARAFLALRERIDETEGKFGVCANKLFYLAAPPPTYKPIFENLAKARLNLPCGGRFGWSRILIEKPFGADLKSARSLQKLLERYFKEEQVYRIDHYFFKEIVQGIENFRFSNNLFENTWDNTTIDRIDISLLETIGAEGRGSFYDSVGALRDVGQNHLLAMLAAVAMDYPSDRRSVSVQENRARVIEMLAPWTKRAIQKDTFRAQYRGYRSVPGVAKNSQSETFFSIKTEIATPRWRGVPVYIRAGKRMQSAQKEITLTLKHPPVCFLCEAGPHRPNRIVFRLEPNDEIVIHFWTKKPGFEKKLEERTFSFFLYEKETKVQYVEEYSKVLFEAMEGDQTFFTASREVEAAWKFTDPITAAWRRGDIPLISYDPDTTPNPEGLCDLGDENCQESASRPGTIGVVGLGKMGANIVRRLIAKKWTVIGTDVDADAAARLTGEKMRRALSLRELVAALPKPRVIWLMVPSGKIVDESIFGKDGLVNSLSRGDTIIDGGNSFYEDTIARSKKLKRYGIHFVDVGVSGGPAGALGGASLMIGGEENVFKKMEPLFRDLAQADGYRFFPGAGAGHFVKMVHNGIEYGMMQSLAEGFALMKQHPIAPNLSRAAEVYNRGSVIESRLVEWLAAAFREYGEDLSLVSGSVDATGEGLWTVETAKKFGIPTPVITDALNFRTVSRRKPSYTGKILSALRNQFGGHSATNT